MNRTLFTILLGVIGTPLFAQSQPGHQFTHNAAGYRTKREYVNNVSYSKPGKNGTQPADTVIGYYRKDPGIEITEKDFFVKAYPNPVHDVMYIENLSWTEGSIAEFKVTDATGKHVLSKRTTLSKDEVQFSEAIVPGNYHVHYYINGAFVITWQIVKL